MHVHAWDLRVADPLGMYMVKVLSRNFGLGYMDIGVVELSYVYMYSKVLL